MTSSINCRFHRRFGVELELNTFDGTLKRANSSNREIPSGSDHIAVLVQKASGDDVRLCLHDYYYNVSNWVIKHDMSCGIEINSSVLKGWQGLESLLKVVDSLSKDKHVKSDDRCSLHVHANIRDLTPDQLASVIGYYIKCEHVFLDAMPSSRKNNRYCYPIGLSDIFDTEFNMEPMELIVKVSRSKYGSINAYHFVQNGGFLEDNEYRTLEFRIAENTACLDAYLTKNWVRFLLHFIEVTKNLPLPRRIKDGGSGLTWLDFKDVYRLLQFDQELSPGMQQVRQWFMDRVAAFGFNTSLQGVWSNAGRIINRLQYGEIRNNLPRLEEDADPVFGEKWKI